jgi:hypothetical protein
MKDRNVPRSLLQLPTGQTTTGKKLAFIQFSIGALRFGQIERYPDGGVLRPGGVAPLQLRADPVLTQGQIFGLIMSYKNAFLC